MMQSGRKSIAGTPLRVVSALPHRVAAPEHLSPAAAGVWVSVVASRPVDYFDAGSLPLLESFVIAVAEHRRISAAADLLDVSADLDVLAKMLRLQDTLAGRIGGLATKLRLSQQSSYDGRAALRAGNKPGGRYASDADAVASLTRGAHG